MAGDLDEAQRASGSEALGSPPMSPPSNPPSRRDFILKASVTLAAAEAAGGLPAMAAPIASRSIAQAPDENAAPAGSVSPEVIEAAERLAGIEFTPAERAQIAATIAEQLSWFETRSSQGPLPNALAPATVFRAMPSGAKLVFRTADGDVSGYVDGDPGPLPAKEIDLAFAPVSRLSAWIRRGALKSRRLTELCLRRLERADRELKCVVTLCTERALAEADRADAEIAAGRWRGPLHGIPWGAKDILDTAAIRTTWGAEPYRERIPSEDAVVVQRLADAGAVLCAKLSVGALAYGDIWFGGRTNAPFDPTLGSSGSSAGSAAAVAAGLVTFAIGTETLGSIVSPCTRCGATGLRPTFGRVARTGCMSLCWSMDKIGPIARTVADTALVLAAIQGFDSSDPSSVSAPMRFDPAADAKGLQVGYDPKWFEGRGASLRPVLAALEESGASLVEISLPAFGSDVLLVPLHAEAAAAFEDLTRDGRDDTLAWQAPEAWPNTFRRTWFIPAVELVQADRFRREAMRRFDALFESIDAIVSPPFAGEILVVSNSTGHPALVQRVGFDDRGRPLSATFTGRLFDEGTLVRLGRAVESKLGVWDVRPEAFAG